MHVRLTCENHPHLRWMCKDNAVTEGGRYNGMRNIFFLGVAVPSSLRYSTFDGETVHNECSCPGSELIRIDE